MVFSGVFFLLTLRERLSFSVPFRKFDMKVRSPHSSTGTRDDFFSSWTAPCPPGRQDKGGSEQQSDTKALVESNPPSTPPLSPSAHSECKHMQIRRGYTGSAPTLIPVWKRFRAVCISLEVDTHCQPLAEHYPQIHNH